MSKNISIIALVLLLTSCGNEMENCIESKEIIGTYLIQQTSSKDTLDEYEYFINILSMKTDILLEESNECKLSIQNFDNSANYIPLNGMYKNDVLFLNSTNVGSYVYGGYIKLDSTNHISAKIKKRANENIDSLNFSSNEVRYLIKGIKVSADNNK